MKAVIASARSSGMLCTELRFRIKQSTSEVRK
jgi:hypothetical protein